MDIVLNIGGITLESRGTNYLFYLHTSLSARKILLFVPQQFGQLRTWKYYFQMVKIVLAVVMSGYLQDILSVCWPPRITIENSDV